MKRIVVLSLILIGTVAYACGPRARSAEPERNDSASKSKVVEGPPIVSALDVKIRDGIELTFRVTNNEPRKLELLFPSGQTHDFVVQDSLGRDVWRWSEGRMFTQAYQNKVLATGETLTLQAAWRAEVKPGHYVAIASLMSENKPVEQRTSFEVR